MPADLTVQLEQAIDAMDTQVNASRELIIRTTEDLVVLDQRLDAHDAEFLDKANVNHNHTLSEVGLPFNFPTAISNAIDLNSGTTLATSKAVNDLNAKVNTKADLVGGRIPTAQLPGYVDDVLTYTTKVSFPVIGEPDKIYIAEDTNKTYRWSGTAYVQIGSDLALGETYNTAYRGDRGKVAFDHANTLHLAIGVSSTQAARGDQGLIAYNHSQSTHLATGETAATAYRGDRGKVAYTHALSAHLSLGTTSSTAYRGDLGAAAYAHAISTHLNASGNFTIGGTWTFTKEVFSNVDFTITSDERLKHNLEPIGGALDKIDLISGYTYDRKDLPDDSRMAGVIAQEIEKVLPEAVVTNDETGMKSVRYNAIIALLIEGMKELRADNDLLRKQLGVKE